MTVVCCNGSEDPVVASDKAAGPAAVKAVRVGPQPAPERRINYRDIPLTSSWHPDMLRSIRVSNKDTEPGRAGVETSRQLADFSSYTGPPMPGVRTPDPLSLS